MQLSLQLQGFPCGGRRFALGCCRVPKAVQTFERRGERMKRQRAQELRAAVDRLPLSTRHAMLEGIDRKPIIVGADGNLGGGVCPMLAASGGSQKEVGKPFARAWDRYAGVKLARRATQRELLTLRTMLVASIEAQTGPAVDLRDGAIVARRAAMAQNRRAAMA
ncbi:MAG TPA: hypothetical protein VHG30_11230, partial [Microvirga sp.]|nr:hypothetical protein [Microvirga sp.]